MEDDFAKRSCKTGRTIYADTDILFFSDIAVLFDKMGDTEIAVTKYTDWSDSGCTKRKNDHHISVLEYKNKITVYNNFNIALDAPYIHRSSGLIALKMGDPWTFFYAWKYMCHFILECGFPIKYNWFEEVALSLLCMSIDKLCVYNIPNYIHYNIPTRKANINLNKIVALHYHKPIRLKRFKEFAGCIEKLMTST
jgi:hypothetical protein